MEPKKFAEMVELFQEEENKILDWKSGEYTQGVDKLQNFKEVASFLGTSPENVALTYLLKHVQSISLAVRTGNYVWAWEKEGGEGMKQRFADAVNYIRLVAACIEDAESKKTGGKE